MNLADADIIRSGSNYVDAVYSGTTLVYPPVGTTTLRFHGATSVLGGANYQMGQLNHYVSFDFKGDSSVSVVKTKQGSDVNISAFSTTGTVQVRNRNASFIIRAKGSRNSAPSTIQGATTNDCVGINGGSPSKIDINASNETEFIEFEIHNLSTSLTFKLKSYTITRVNYANGGPNPELTDFSGYSDATQVPLVGGSYLPTDKYKFESSDYPSSNLSVTGLGAGSAGSFKLGIDGGVSGGNNSKYGLYELEFDVTN